MHIFTLLRKKEGSIHWYGQRITAIAAIPLLVWLIFKGALLLHNYNEIYQVFNSIKNNYSYITAITILFLLWHSKIGIESIIDDYVHDDNTRFLAYSITRIMLLLFVKYLYILLCIQ